MYTDRVSCASWRGSVALTLTILCGDRYAETHRLTYAAMAAGASLFGILYGFDLAITFLRRKSGVV
jgi:hypothetical protein